ncbi:MAG: DUF2779 domain-containing protein, partial [Chloroflexi bacterium]|nr:DUF2779 domain-containing protein [Chloroflexota bacterium]
MSTAKTPTLSKSRFSAGLQCLKRLYLEVYEPELAQEPDAGQQALFDMGNRVGALARGLFPGGRLVDAPYDRHDQGVAATEAALADPSVPALFEAAFSFQGIRIRCDILRRNSDGSLDLNEVKSSTRVKDEHIPDAAIQLYVLEGLGLRVRGVHLLHINSSYVYQGGEYDLQGLFQADDITSEAHAFLATEAPGNLAAMWDALAQGEAPDIETGPHCKQPYVCPFYDHCHAGLPEHYIGQLPRARENLLGGLRSAGILDIRDIPAGYPGLSAIQRRVWEGAHSGRPYVGGGLPRELAQVRPPVHFLDFETVNPALPLFPGTRPYQAVPFQWSLHTLEGGGRLRHRAFLHEG